MREFKRDTFQPQHEYVPANTWRNLLNSAGGKIYLAEQEIVKDNYITHHLPPTHSKYRQQNAPTNDPYSHKRNLQIHLNSSTSNPSSSQPKEGYPRERTPKRSRLPIFLVKFIWNWLTLLCIIYNQPFENYLLQQMNMNNTIPLANNYPTDVLPDQSVHPFHEAFSSLSWAPNSFTLFATTAWDGEVRVFEVVNGAYSMAIVQKFSYKFPSPALKCTWNDLGNQLYIGFMDGSIKAYDFGSNQIQDVGRQNEAISSLHYIPGSNALISSGYEPTINIWQIGCPTPALTINANYTVYTSEFQFPLLVAGTAQEKNMFIDITNPNTRTFIESSDLGKNSQIQSLALSNKADLVGIATFDGRANISNVIKNHQSQYSTKSAITFKSNKKQETGGVNPHQLLHPINAVSFNPKNSFWFMTAGADGFMHFWDYSAKNKIKMLNYGDVPICVAKVNPSGNMVAYGLGNDWHLGAEGNKWETKLGVHIITDAEIKYK